MAQINHCVNQQTLPEVLSVMRAQKQVFVPIANFCSLIFLASPAEQGSYFFLLAAFFPFFRLR